jgi:hypothetical protein
MGSSYSTHRQTSSADSRRGRIGKRGIVGGILGKRRPPVGLLDKAKAAAEQAAARAKEGVDDVQTKRELSQAYSELGRTTYDLIAAGELTDPRLGASAERIRGLREKADGDGTPDANPDSPT